MVNSTRLRVVNIGRTRLVNIGRTWLVNMRAAFDICPLASLSDFISISDSVFQSAPQTQTPPYPDLSEIPLESILSDWSAAEIVPKDAGLPRIVA